MMVNDSSYSEINNQSNLGDIVQKRFVIVVSEWSAYITEKLYQAAYQTLIGQGAEPEDIIRRNVPGSFELTLAAQWAAQEEDTDAVICLGCIIRGETKHFDFIAEAVAQGITQVNLKYNKPVIFGVLTTESKEQALERAGGKHGNKGTEAAIAAVKMLKF